MANTNVMAEKKQKTLRMVQTALLAALEIALTLLVIPVGAINLNFGLVPIVIAGVFLSPLTGAFIGAVSGVVTMIQVLGGQTVFYAFLLTANPFMACVLCVVKTAAAGFLCGYLYKLLSRRQTIASVVAAAICPIANTGIFALGMLTIFGNALMADPQISTWTTGGLLALVFVVLIGVNFFIEVGMNLILCPVLIRTLKKTKFFPENK